MTTSNQPVDKIRVSLVYDQPDRRNLRPDRESGSYCDEFNDDVIRPLDDAILMFVLTRHIIYHLRDLLTLHN